MANQPIPRPFLKWAGGKTQLLGALDALAPRAFGAYLEPFVGSGALFFHLSRAGRLGRVLLSDANAELIDTYCALRDDVEAVIDRLAGHSYDRDHYYAVRALDPWTLDRSARAARMIYLNKTGYNGLYRVNRHGRFNVPFGRYNTPLICDAGNLRAVAAALREAELVCLPFATAAERAGRGDLVYFDPPYAPLSATARFTAYQRDGFALDDQARLRDTCLALTGRGVQVLVSNSDTPAVHALYADPAFRLHSVLANRAINSRAGGRGKVTELIIANGPGLRPPADAG